MLIKPRFRLTARDLPFVESPHLAARRVRQVLDSGAGLELRFDPSEIPGLPVYSGSDATRARLLSALESGQVMLVLEPGSSNDPLNPPVNWRADSLNSADGRWVPDSASMPFPLLSQELDRLNRLGETPESLASFGRMGLTPSQVGQSAGAKDAAEASGPTERKLSLPLGAAAGIAPLAEPASQAHRNQADDTDLPVHLTIGIFLDGTLNNYENMGLFRQRLENECIEPIRQDPEQLEACRERLRLLMGESYANGPTNVVKLWRLYLDSDETLNSAREVSLSVYQPGVGTETGESDSLIGMATGMGATGIIEQTENAYQDISDRIKEVISSSGQMTKLTLDFFGFSRGAAAARHIVNDVLREKDGRLFEVLAEANLQWPNEVRVRFVGLFDTVPGVVNLKLLDHRAGNDRNFPIQTYLDSKRIGEAVQLTAADEIRANFSLKSLVGDDGQLPENFREISMPGAHSDIGGGYQDMQRETVLVQPVLSVEGSLAERPQETIAWDQLTGFRERLLGEGWVGRHSLDLPGGEEPEIWIQKDRSEHPSPDGRVDLSLRMRRYVRGEYSRVALRIMHHYALRSGLPLDVIDEQDADYSLPSELQPIYESAYEQILRRSDVIRFDARYSDLLKQRYLHYSNHYNLLEFVVGNYSIGSEVPFDFLQPSKPTLSRERTVHPNH